MTAELPRLVVFSDDWGRHPSSCQHLIRALLPRYRVDWVNTVGTRRPGLNAADFRRGMEKLRSWMRPKVAQDEQDRHENLRVHSPMHWPGFGNKLERALNRKLLMRALRPILYAEPAPSAVITTASIVADLARATSELNWIYYCVDDLSAWPGLDAETLRRMEQELVPSVRGAVAVSKTLLRRLDQLGRSARLLTHGIDLDHWRGLSELARPENPERPVALYWGNADRRLDARICLRLAEDFELRMLGPRSEIDPALARCPGLRWMEPVPYAELPAQAAHAHVLVMPYADLPVTRAMQPLKLKEYLATGLPVVATPLPANQEWSAALDLSADPEEFAALALKRAQSGATPEQLAARRTLENESWESKALAFERAWTEGANDAIGTVTVRRVKPRE